MNITLSQKERMLLEDQKTHEQLCIEKYTNYANQASDASLKQMFLTHASAEQQHLNTLTQMLQGTVPNINEQGQGNQQATQPAPTNSNAQAGMTNQNDANLCKDLLMTEKYVSSAYNTTIFEFRDASARQVLNHIQKEEQEHGEDIYNYMSGHGMYNVQ